MVDKKEKLTLWPYKTDAPWDLEWQADRREMFDRAGNGWWWGDGVWNGKHESSMERQRRYREGKNA